jgi:uncharacterized repeat protein (TIGR01451 family)
MSAATPRIVLFVLSFLSGAHAAAADWPTPRAAPPAPAPSVAPVALRAASAVRAVDADTFESYTPGPIANQGGWYVPALTGDAEIVSAGIDGRSLRVFATPQTAFTYSAGRLFAPEPGVLAIDLVVPPLQTYFFVSPFSDTGPVTGLLTSHLTLSIANSRVGYVFQRFDLGSGEYVRLNTTFEPGQRTRLAWDVRPDGRVLFYRDGRLLFEGRSESLTYEGTPRPIGAFLVGTGNGVPRDASGAANVLTFDNLSGALPTLPPDTAPDLVMQATLSDPAPGAAVVGRGEIAPGGSAPLTLTVRNASSVAATNVVLGGVLPIGYTLDSSECPVAQVDTEWSLAPRNLAPGATVRCRLRLRIAASVPVGEGWDIPFNAQLTETDAYGDSNTAWTTVIASVFGNGFESP